MTQTWQRPEDMVEATRWLFAGLALFSLLLALPGALATPSSLSRLMALTAAAALTAAIITGYRRRRPSRLLDVVDATALTALALGSTNPSVALGVLFAMLWFRALYGSTRGAVLRCALYAVGLVAAVSLWPYVPGHSGPTDKAMLGVLPTMFLTVVVGRHLAGILDARQQAARRDSAHAALGPQLLAVNDAAKIRNLAWVAVNAICGATPGLRVMKVARESGLLRVGRTSNGFVSVPEILSLDAVHGSDARDEPPRRGAFLSAELDAAAGARCSWVAVALPEVPEERAQAWFLLGFAGDVSDEVVSSVASLTDQVALALRNSEVHRELTVLATLDSLTGLANRASFNAALSAALSNPRHPGQHTTVLFADLDDFKDVNDVLGHSAGDELLQEVAARLVRATRPGDLCARLGGDEFAVLLAGTPAAVGIEVAARVVQSLGAPCQLSRGTARVSASVGVATSEGAADDQELMHYADVAMYAAKANGKGRVQTFEPGLLRDPSLQSL